MLCQLLLSPLSIHCTPRQQGYNELRTKGFLPMSNELDGVYRITSTTNYQGPLEKRSDGETTIRNGQTERTDNAGCLWTSTFTVIDDNTVEMESVADPENAHIDFLLRRPDGSPTRDKVTYRSRLKLARKEDKIQMSGQIEYGDEIVFLTLRKTTNV